jgi:hypothetical protein
MRRTFVMRSFRLPRCPLPARPGSVAMIRGPADKAMVTTQVSRVQGEPDSAAIPSGPGVRHPPGGHFRCLGTSTASPLETVNPRRRAAPINSNLMNRRACIVRPAGAIPGQARQPTGVRQLHAELNGREAMFPLDDGEAAARHREKPVWLPLTIGEYPCTK